MKKRRASSVPKIKLSGATQAGIESLGLRSQREIAAEVLKEEIRVAFKGVMLGTGVGLFEAQAIDDYADEPEQAAQREKDEKVDWTNIPASALSECNSSPSFFDPKGMLFHLPAYLIADLNGEYGFGMAYCLTMSTTMEKSFSLLNTVQRSVVRNYLSYILEESDYEFDHEHVLRALTSYWSS